MALASHLRPASLDCQRRRGNCAQRCKGCVHTLSQWDHEAGVWTRRRLEIDESRTPTPRDGWVDWGKRDNRVVYQLQQAHG
jgi:hypothetical protein